MTARRYLLVSRVGPDSLHAGWLKPDGDRNFDVLLSAYHPSVARPVGGDLMFEYRPGRKVAGYAEILREHAETIRRYDYIALFDDDIQADRETITKIFELASAHDLKIAQPAITHDSHFTYACLLHHRGFQLRHLTYIEMMCPVFRVDILFRVRPLFELGFESGIDLIWCNLVGESPKDFAVIDAAPVRHTRAVGSMKALNGFVAGRRYEDDIEGILRRFSLPWLPCLPYGGLRRDGAYTERRMDFLPDAARLALVSGLQPPIAHRARNIATYWAQLLRKPARNIGVIGASQDMG